MSLILDALKKSEAERRRGLPPGISTPFSAPRRRSRAPWVAGAGALVLAAGLAGGWMWMGRGREPIAPDLAAGRSAAPMPASDIVKAQGPEQIAVASEIPSFPPAEVAMETAQSRAQQIEAMGGASDASNGGQVSGGGLPMPERAGLFTPSATPQPQVAGTPEVPPAQASVAPSAEVAIAVAPPVAMGAEQIAPMPTDSVQPPAPDQATFNGQPAMQSDMIPPEFVAPMAAQKPELPQEQMLLVHQLSYAVRKELPKLDLSMHVFSPVAAERFVVLNGKRFQLDSPAPGPDLNLVDIVSDGVVLEFRGQRFLLPRTTY